MSRIAIYPGTFDPVTLGHIDVIKKSLKIVDKLIVATAENIEKKEHLFEVDERIEILKKSLFYDLHLNKNKIKIISFDGLTTKLCKKYKYTILDKTEKSFVLEISALKKEIDELVKKLQPLGLASTSRTGVLAMTKGPEIYKQN